MSLKCLIVDDERFSRSYISDLIAEFLPDADVLQASSAREGLDILRNLPVDILFLDIQMPEMDGLTMLGELHDRKFQLVFITAYSQYAIKAIKESATDYLLKPIRKSEFREMIEKVIARINQARLTEEKKDKRDLSDILLQKLPLTHQHGIHIVTLKELRYIKADNTYTILKLVDGKKIITTKPIGRLESILPAEWFFRIHKSYIINLYYFRNYSSKGGDFAVMDDGEELPVSRYRLSDFLAILKDNPDNITL